LEKIILKNKNIDFVSISDIISYFEKDKAYNFFEKIRNSLKQKSVIVSRNYLNLPKVNIKGYNDITNRFKKNIDDEKTQMYIIKIYQKK